ncbi:MAG: OHCU decarboxylase [Candidatus Sericytochromatia bacterium]|nr:MAG: OHCU decarboxylase [Candidatus Sericytochromatia bacterium]
MSIEKLNNLDDEKRLNELLKCCGSRKWAITLNNKFPFNSIDDLIKESDNIWFSLNKEDWLEAFSHHPKIGDIENLSKKFPNTASLSKNEQAGVNNADKKTLEELAIANKYYENKFGYIFIVCASGKTATEMLDILNNRKNNNPDDEIKIACKEQSKITKIRLLNLIKN